MPRIRNSTRVTHHALLVACLLLMTACGTPRSGLAQQHKAQDSPRPPVSIPAPEQVIGHAVGADYKLARWDRITEYFQQLGAASPRINVRNIDTSTEGRPYLLCEISSAANLAELERYRGYQARLADPRLLSGAAERREILVKSKTTILVSCGLHSNEVAASQMSMELAWELASRDDPEVRAILDNCIILLVPCANPDGLDKIAEWYDGYIGTPFEGGRMPWMYQTFAGHDNNRDWFMLNLKETQILTKVLYTEWFPTILYDIHQMGNRGPRFFVPPFFDPVNPNVDPLIHQSLLIIGGHMATSLQEQGKTGVVFKAIYDNWWQGGNRTTPYRHNIVGILSEAASAKRASPVFQDYGDLGGGYRGLPEYAPAVNFPEPWPGGWWRLRDIVDYQKISCYALFTLAARYRDRFVTNHLTLSDKALRLGLEQPPYGWLVPPGQRDPGAATHMLRVLQGTGIEVNRARSRFDVDGATYPAGTFVMLASQPFRPHLKDMMEVQDYPDRRTYPGGPAEAPYDSAGWTLPLQMGVRAVTAFSPVQADLERVQSVDPAALRPPPPAFDGAAGYITHRHANADFAAVNALLADGAAEVLIKEWDGHPIGSIVVPAAAASAARMRELLQRWPATFEPLSGLPAHSFFSSMTAPRTALYQPWTASMDEGWTRFVLEQSNFAYTTIHNADIRAGQLRERFDCIIMPSQSSRSQLEGVSDKYMPPPYAGGIGEQGAVALERFVRAGGTLTLINSACGLATNVLRVPVKNALSDVGRDKFFCPGSLLRMTVDNTQPLGYGLPDEIVGYFARSQAFLTGEAALKQTASADEDSDKPAAPAPSDEEIKAKVAEQPVSTVVRYAGNVVLMSGWILGEDYIRNRTAVCEVSIGEGQVVLLGFSVQHRGQPHGTFKLLFNAIYRSTLKNHGEK